MTRILYIVSLASLLVAQPYTSSASPRESLLGRNLYWELCVPCHGATGTGGGLGPSIVTDEAVRLNHSEISEAIRLGRREMGMPAFGGYLGWREVNRLVTHIRALQGVDTKRSNKIDTSSEAALTASGKNKFESIAKGRALFEGRATCFDCHGVFDDGGRTAPDLSRIAKRMTRKQIRDSIERPSRKIATGFEFKEIVTRDGRTIRGRSRSATDDTVQIFDEEEQLWTTYFIRNLDSQRIIRRSSMPNDLLDRLSETERDDLMNFLESLK